MIDREGDFGGFDELPDEESIDWAITRSLLSANDATSAALEAHLLRTQYRSADESGTNAIRRHIDEAIERHEQIIEDLRFAREGLDHDRS